MSEHFGKVANQNVPGQESFLKHGFLRESIEERGHLPAKHELFATVTESMVEDKSLVLKLVSNGSVQNSSFVSFQFEANGSLQLTAASSLDTKASGKVENFVAATQKEKGSNNTVVAFGESTVFVQHSPFSFRVQFPNGKVLCSVLDDRNVGDSIQSAPVMKSESGFAVALECGSSERFFGTGEDFSAFEKSGQKRMLANADSLGNHGQNAYQNLPVLFSSRGLSFEFAGDEPASFDVKDTRNDILVLEQGSNTLSIKVNAKNSVADSVRAFRECTGAGTVAGVPDWSYELWLSRCFYADEAEVRQVWKKARDLKVDFGVINLDARCWMNKDRRTDFVPDETRFSDFKKLIQELREDNVAVSLWENPYVSETAGIFEEGAKSGYFAKTESGEVYPYQWVPPGLPGFPQPPLCGLVDFTNLDAVAWWQDKHRPLLQMGVQCFKTDFGEEIPADAVFANGQKGYELRNKYADMYNLAVMSVVQEVHGEEGILFARSGYRNVQSYPVKWAGDGQTTWRSLRATLRAGLSQSFGGAAFWSHDVGGFYGEPPTPELFVRWSQLAMWGSTVRLHGTTAREPWEFGEGAFELFQQSNRLRKAVLPYLIQVGKECVSEKQSFMRPMLFLDESNPSLQNIDDQFCVGEDIVVAPFLEPEVLCEAQRGVHLPKGEWVDLRTGTEVSVSSNSGLHQVVNHSAMLPVFYRKGSAFESQFQAATKLIQSFAPVATVAEKLQ